MAKAKDESAGPSMMDMVLEALQTLGPKAKPQAIQDAIREKHNREIPKGIISNYKTGLKKKGKIPGVVRGSKASGGRATSEATAANGSSVQLEDLETVRGLVSRLGADQVKRLVNVLS